MNNLEESIIRDISKRLIQIFYWTIEASLFTYLFYKISNVIEPTTTTWSIIERIAFCYGVYQFIVYMILSNCNDIRRDSYLALLLNYKLMLLYAETNESYLHRVIDNNIARQLDDAVLNDTDIRKEYHKMKVMIDNLDISSIKEEIIYSEHLVEESNLMWKFSFLLRHMKNK